MIKVTLSTRPHQPQPSPKDTTIAEPLVEAHGFSWRHASRSNPAFADIDLEIQRGEKILLAGKSGAGKSTLLLALAGILGPEAAEEDGDASGILQVRGTVGMVLQDPDSQVIATRVGDDVAFGCENLGIPREEIWPRVERALKMVGLDVPLNHPTANLSGGQKQRLALAGVIAMGAELIILDEPTANLDPIGVKEVVRAVDTIISETNATLIVVEHRPQHWLPLIERVLYLDHSGLREISAEELPGLPQLSPARPVGEDTPALLETRDLKTRFGPPRNVKLPQAASTVITGVNGSGKTTLALTMAGLLKARGGELITHQDLARGLAKTPYHWRSKDLAQRIGMVFQDPEHQFLARTVEEELHIGPRVMGMAEKEAEARVEELLQRLKLTHLKKANPFSLSGGEKRRLSVATALVCAPALLILDEPTFGQDPETLGEMVHLLRELTDEGITICSVTHDEAFIEALGDHHIEVTAA